MRELPEIEAYGRACEHALAQQAKASGLTSDQTSFLERQISKHIRDLVKISQLSAAGNEKGVVRLQSRTLRSFSSRLCGTLHELTAKRLPAEPLSSLSWEDFERMVQTNPLASGQPDTCSVFKLKKANGKRRVVTSPGLQTRGAQKALGEMINARGLVSSYDFNCKGRGPKAALLEIARLMEEDQRRFFVVFDLADYFSSVKPKHLQGFKLPKEVLQSVVFYNRRATLKRSVNNTTRLTFGGKCDPARRGMPQGATCSGKLANALLGRELRELSGDLGIVTYVDDGVIGVRTQPEARDVAQALEWRFTNLSGGPIHFKHIDVNDARAGFAFLGYWVRLAETATEPVIRFTPSHQAKRKFRRKLLRRLGHLGPSASWDEALLLLEGYRKNWLAQKPLWQPSDDDLRDFEIETETWVDDFFNGYTEKLPISRTSPAAKR